MSTLWTPGGERPVGRPTSEPQATQPPPTPTADEHRSEPDIDEAEVRAQMEQMRQQLVDAPAEVVIANHCFGMFELAALHLSQSPPQLAKAKLAVDALGALVEGLEGRLGEAEGQLRDALASLRVAYVQVQGGAQGAGGTTT